MKCPDCGGKVEIHHSYSAGKNGRTSGGICAGCNERWTFVTIAAHKMTGHGTGAYAVAQKLRRDGLGDLLASGESK